ncbi:MAG: LCP family protein [Candidatus Gracilibacteria bacterium]
MNSDEPKIHPHLRGVHLALFSVSIAVFVLAIGFSFSNKKIVQELQIKDMQVNSLIQEIGELKQENLQLYQVLSQNTTTLDSIETQVEKWSSQNYSAIDLSNKLSKTMDALEEKSQIVNSLVIAGTERSTTAVIKDDTLDFLILGTHGSLTDTIMLASVNETKKTVSLFSIPRDLVVNGRRINEFYYRYGIDPMRDEIAEITGLYPEKYAVIDMEAFSTTIDLLGGVDVTVEKAIYDSLYPGANGGYSTFSISAGAHHLNGTEALKYARSRESTTDFDRAKRQQQIVEAVREKIEALNWVENMGDFIGMYNAVIDSLDTDVDLLSAASYVKAYKDYTIEDGNVLSTSNYLYHITGIDGAYLLVPKDETYNEIHEFVRGIVEN